VTDAWDAVNDYNFQTTPIIENDSFIGTLEHYCISFAQEYFGCTIVNGVNPEFGGVGIGIKFRTPYNLRNVLLEVEQATGKQHYFKAASLRIMKESEDSLTIPEFRPWERFPKGPTQERMSLIGKLHGLNHELESLYLRSHNKFVLDSKWYQETLDQFAKRIMQTGLR